MLSAYRVDPFSAGTLFIRQNLDPVDKRPNVFFNNGQCRRLVLHRPVVNAGLVLSMSATLAIIKKHIGPFVKMRAVMQGLGVCPPLWYPDMKYLVLTYLDILRRYKDKENYNNLCGFFQS